jgi:hypothetical protein
VRDPAHSKSSSLQRLCIRNVDFDREPRCLTQAFSILAGVFPPVKGNVDVVEPRGEERVDVIEACVAVVPSDRKFDSSSRIRAELEARVCVEGTP